MSLMDTQPTLFPEVEATKRRAKPAPPPANPRDPFRLEGPTCINFSGGRTSGRMLYGYLQRGLTDGAHVLFCNTGKEKKETLDFVLEVSLRWQVRVRWLEFHWSGEGKPECLEVSFNTARRNGEPFEELIRWKQMLPNRSQRFCTQFLKLWCAEQFMRRQGFDHWTSAVGIRADEPKRIARLKGREAQPFEDLALPLYDAGIAEAHVLDFWSQQPFDLALPPGSGNCTKCFLKGAGIRLREMMNDPEETEWWLRMEEETGHFWINPLGGRPSFRTLYQLAINQQAIDLDDELEPSFDCFCGE